MNGQLSNKVNTRVYPNTAPSSPAYRARHPRGPAEHTGLIDDRGINATPPNYSSSSSRSGTPIPLRAADNKPKNIPIRTRMRGSDELKFAPLPRTQEIAPLPRAQEKQAEEDHVLVELELNSDESIPMGVNSDVRGTQNLYSGVENVPCKWGWNLFPSLMTGSDKRIPDDESDSSDQSDQSDQSDHICIDIDKLCASWNCFSSGASNSEPMTATDGTFIDMGESNLEENMWNCFRSCQTRDQLLDQQPDSPSLRTRMYNAIRFVTQNEAETTAGRYACNIANILIARLPSVGFSTTDRQILARVFGRLAASSPMIGWVMGATPVMTVIATHLWAHIHDNNNGLAVDRSVKKFARKVQKVVKETLGIDRQVDPSLIHNFCNELIHTMTAHLENDDGMIAAIESKCKLEQPGETIPEYGPIDNSNDEFIQLEEEDAGVIDNVALNGLEDLLKKIEEQLGKHITPNQFANIQTQIKQYTDQLRIELEGKTWTTSTTTFLRVLDVVFVSALSSISSYYAILPTIGATLIAYAIYCVLREISQLFIVASDNIPKYFLKATLLAGLAYCLNQTVVGFLMSEFAGRSGQAAIDLTFTEALRNDVLRGVFNWIGESVDLLTLLVAQSVQQGEPLKVRLEAKIPTVDQVMNTFTGLNAVRMSLFTELVLFSSNLFNFVKIDESLGDYRTKWLTSFTDGVYLGGRYAGLVGEAARVNWPYDDHVQTGGVNPR